MSESVTTGIVDQVAVAMQLAERHGLPRDEADVLRALALNALDGNAPLTWTPEQKSHARQLAQLLQTDGELVDTAQPPSEEESPLVATPGVGERISALEDERWSVFVSRFSNAFGVGKDIVEAWMSGSDATKADWFRRKLRWKIGFENGHVLGFLLRETSQGGVGLTIQDVEVLGIGLGYVCRGGGSRLTISDDNQPTTFCEFVGECEGINMDMTVFCTNYYTALDKLCTFLERRQQAERV